MTVFREMGAERLTTEGNGQRYTTETTPRPGAATTRFDGASSRRASMQE